MKDLYSPPTNKIWILFACVFVVGAICCLIYQPKFPSFYQQASQSQDFDIFADLFHLPEAFKMDYLEMERSFKIVVYPHNTNLCDKPRKLDGEYGNEALFFENLKQSRFLTKYPDKAHLFLIPISCHSFPAEGRSEDERAIAVEDFVKSLISEYPYWNRTLGADHFFISCADIDVTSTSRIVDFMKNSIRFLCSPTYNIEYVPHKDVSLPRSVQPFDVSSDGLKTRKRKTLAFWRGLTDSYVRKTLVKASLFFGSGMDIAEGLKFSTEEGRRLYHEHLYTSKFCICAGGPQLDGDLAVAINYACVPVILTDHYDLPFKDILDWHKFSIILKYNNVYDLEEILERITKQQYEVLYNNTIMVQKHFQWNLAPVRLDAFHMLTYEFWTRHHVTKYDGATDSFV